MDYIKIRFGGSLDQFRNELARTIESLFGETAPFSMSPRTWRPPMDIHETADEIVMVCLLAGVEKDDVEVEMDNRAVRISGMRKEPPRNPDARFHLAEIPYGKFERILVLPVPVDPEKTVATFSNGTLEIRMKKLNQAGRRVVKVTRG
ncbi:MAG: Hsp20/alpha crystallin family protein [Deltaproteobacteria bacterium]|nr:Hsp20/alpha crystallin family protein [Deltaproteobacteria bacterium]